MAAIDVDVEDPPCSPGQPMRRVQVVYGRRSDPRPPPADGREQNRVYHPSTVPSQRRASSSPSPSVHASDTECSRSPNPAGPFQFGFRSRLKELDEQFDDHDPPKPSPSLSSQAVRAGPSQTKDLQSFSMGTTTFSSEARRPARASLPRSATSLRATSVQEHPPESPLARRRARKVPIPSDSEAEEPSDSSSVSPVRHVITTPHSRSSPTPPTSGEVPILSRKAMGKALACDVLPLLSDAERPLAPEFPSRSKKRRQNVASVRPKIKAPTKKERREAAFESSRIAANRPVEVMRTQEQKHSLASFFAGLRRDSIMTSTPGTELPSDPIERFSSPTDNSARVLPLNSVFGAPTGLLKTSVPISRPSLENTMATDESDDEMPSVTSIIQQASGKQERLQEIKQIALQHANTSKVFDTDSEDDDLVIVKDDMHAVAREEAAQRRLDKAHGSPVKDVTSLRKINHPSIRPAVASPLKLSKQELQELAKPSFARIGKSAKGRLSQKQLDQLMIMQHTREQLKSIQRHEEEWVKGGGKLSRDTGGDNAQTSLSQTLGAYAEQGLKAVGTSDAVGDEASADSDEDYTPDLQSSASPESRHADEDNGEPGDNMEISQVLQPPVDDDDDDDDVIAPLRRNKSGQRNPRVVVGSDDEGEQPVQRNSPTMQRDSVSSMESQTEDENDKENSAKLMYDRSEDKENKAVVRHELSSSELAFGLRLGSLHRIEDGIPRNHSPASATEFNDITDSPKGSVRSPLKDISKDEDDFCLSLPPSKPPYTERLLHCAVILSPHASTSTLSFGSPAVSRTERVSRINRLSLDSDNNENDPCGLKSLQPSFLERLHSQVSPEPSFASINPVPNGGFSQLFSAEDRCLKKPVDGLSLTLDVGLKPALEVSGTLKQKAETIFEKEQEYVVAAAVRQTDRPKEPLYVNDHGFLTQTRPEGSSPQVYRITPSQASKFTETQVHSTQTQPPNARPPLRTLSLTVSQELSPEPRLRRLRKRSSSPLEQKILGKNPVSQLNAFSVLGKAPKPPFKSQKEIHEKSEFVVVEAEESDEDDMFGFGCPKKDDDEEDDNEQDKVVEGLVDDVVMDAETEAADLIQEKHREYEEEDDQRLQKLHQDAIEGKFRTKRRDRGVGFEDDSDDDDDDDDARRTRQRIHKRRKIEGDSLEALGQNEETRAFYNTYHQDLVDEDDEFGHLQEDVAMSVSDGDAQAEEPEERETVSVDEIRQRVRDLAQNNSEVEVLDPEDTSWIDQSMVIEADDAVHVKVVEHRWSKSTARHPNVNRTDFDAERPKRHVESEQERKQMTSWAKNQNHRRQGTGRSGNSAAVTGHTKAKTGGGSLRSTQLSIPVSVNETHRTKTSSLLSTVSNRKGKFA